MNIETKPYILSEASIFHLFLDRYARFIRTDYQIIICPANETHAQATEKLHLQLEDVIDAGYLEAQSDIFPVLIVRDYADTIGLTEHCNKWKGYERDDTIGSFVSFFSQIKVNATTVRVERQ
jgi:hypothetical protein